MSIYENSINEVLKGCDSYLSHHITIDDFKSLIWCASQQIVSIEEKKLRSYLQQVEAELDSLQFTIDSDKLFQKTGELLKKMQEKLQAEVR